MSAFIMPATVRVKISSEAAEMIALTPVVLRDMPLAELVAVVVAAIGKDAARLKEILARGSFTSGASRFRWDSVVVDDLEAEALLAEFPSPDPSRAFAPASCVHVAIRGRTGVIEIDREAATRRRLFRRRALWDELLALARAPAYAGYSYKYAADVYTATLAAAEQERLRAAARLSPYSAIAARIEAAAMDTIEFYVTR